MKRLLSFLAKVLAIVAVIIIVITLVALTFGAGLGAVAFTVMGTAVTVGSLLAIGVGMLTIAFVLDPDAAGEVVARAVEAFETVAEGVVDVLSAGLGALVTSPLGLVLGGVAAFLLLRKTEKGGESNVSKE